MPAAWRLFIARVDAPPILPIPRFVALSPSTRGRWWSPRVVFRFHIVARILGDGAVTTGQTSSALRFGSSTIPGAAHTSRYPPRRCTHRRGHPPHQANTSGPRTRADFGLARATPRYLSSTVCSVPWPTSRPKSRPRVRSDITPWASCSTILTGARCRGRAARCLHVDDVAVGFQPWIP